MKFSGILKTSLLDFPDNIASVLFTPGCNLRCPFCHNWRIALDPKPPFLREEAALKILDSRRKYVDSVVVTGGEPTTHNELPRFLFRLQERNFKVKLDTNGINSKLLEECLPFVDYVAMDVKTSTEKYHLLGAVDTSGFRHSIEILKAGKVEYEFRTTLVPGLVGAGDIERIGELVKGAGVFALQQFVPNDTLDKKFENVTPYGHETVEGFAETMRKYVGNVTIRL